jgi:alternative ribosome-rescue factor
MDKMSQQKDRQYDGRSRPTNDTYRKRWDEIFNKNPMAKEVRTPQYKSQIVKPKKGKGSFKRKNGITEEIN